MIKNKDWYLTSAEFAELSNLSDDYIRKLISRGKIKGEKLGRNWIIPKDQLKLITRQRAPRVKDTYQNGIGK